ncbi:MAG: PEP-CTERM sorting domain-containing protein [Pirellulales bacterium]
MNGSRCSILFVAASLALFGMAQAGDAVTINEIRIEQPSTDRSEYFELHGTSGESLDGLSYVVIGDGASAAGSGVIDAVIDLTDAAIPGDGFFLATEASFENGAGDTFDGIAADLVTSLNFENSDNVTHLLVNGFTGRKGDDLDTNDDGVLDVTPWSSVVDGVALIEEPNPPTGTEYEYGTALGLPVIGPDGTSVPRHVFRETNGSSDFAIGGSDLGENDTPGAPNIPTILPGDMDLDGDIDFDDIAPFVLALNDPAAYETDFGVPPSQRGDTDGDGDMDFDDIPGFVNIFETSSIQTVPEPSTLVLVLLGSIPCMLWRSTRRS